MRLRRLIGAAVALSLMAFITPSTAVAAPPRQEPVVHVDGTAPPGYRPWTKQQAADRKLALKIRRAAQDGRTLDYKKAWKVTHNKRVLREYIRGVRAGGGRVIHAPKGMSLMSAQLMPRCSGVNDAGPRPYGYRFRADSCKALIMIAVSGSVAAVAGLLGGIYGDDDPEKIVSAVIEFTFTWAAIELTVCALDETGVRIFYVVAGSFVFCRSQ